MELTRDADGTFHKECAICKTPFKSSAIHAKYCSRKCINTAAAIRNAQKRRRIAEEKKQREKNRPMTIHEIGLAARKEGLTYGQYVSKYGV